MEISLDPGRYVVAVSGGVDSVVLLDVLHSLSGVELIVAHYDHGIRTDSHEDQQLVERLAEQSGLSFFSEEGTLGSSASEELARVKRYDFLRRVQKEVHAQAIITAHHQDDVLETAILNLLRGTGRKGLSSLGSTPSLVRPLLHVSKQDILVYAKSHRLQWREDSTNTDIKYVRNYVRHVILPRFDLRSRAIFCKIISTAQSNNARIDTIINELVDIEDNKIPRSLVVWSPYAVSAELLAAWLRAHDIEFNKNTIARLVVQAKTLPLGKTVDVLGGYQLRLTKDFLHLEHKVTTRQRVKKSV